MSIVIYAVIAGLAGGAGLVAYFGPPPDADEPVVTEPGLAADVPQRDNDDDLADGDNALPQNSTDGLRRRGTAVREAAKPADNASEVLEEPEGETLESWRTKKKRGRLACDMLVLLLIAIGIMWLLKLEYGWDVLDALSRYFPREAGVLQKAFSRSASA